jgi:pimeloyl-ACP methyl ester carboxylesterase
MTAPSELPPIPLPPGVRARMVPGVNGLAMHVLEAGFESPGRPCLLLLHGFPELAYSWRKVMAALAAEGYHVVAPDQRGYGRTTGWRAEYDADLAPFRALNLARDALGLVWALGYHCVAAVVGHDMGSSVAAWCALVRPDVFRSLVMMSSPFRGPPPQPAGAAPPGPDVHAELAALARPRKHYQWYYATRAAAGDLERCPQGVHAFLRAYFHYKSADWKDNRPFRLAGWNAAELAKMPTYYIMNLAENMAQTVAAHMPSSAQIAACRWLTDDELSVYAAEYRRTGFQGGLQWYRCATGGAFISEHQLYSGRRIEVPACYIAGASDWGTYQIPGALDKMSSSACARFAGCHLVEGAGHWVQQEQPEAVLERLRGFLRATASGIH